jgi:4-hydroxyphenylpyruvate dioxygenase
VRASSLLSARRDSPRGAQELMLPAIVAPGGTIVQFVPRGQSVEADFIPEDASPPRSGGSLQTIDHVAMALAPDRFDTWVLFTRAVLGLIRGERVDVADPFGLIQSCGIADVDRRVRFVLNVSVGDRTEMARRLSAAGSSGGSVHHMAFGCADIFATVRALRMKGVRFVPISPNYYDDLEARVALDHALVDRMRDLDVLYDADLGGEFFHAYAETLDGRFFFEVVDRRGYDGYGATNAVARMAALDQQQKKDSVFASTR